MTNVYFHKRRAMPSGAANPPRRRLSIARRRGLRSVSAGVVAALGALAASSAVAGDARAHVTTHVFIADAPLGAGGTIDVDVPWNEGPQFDRIEPAAGAPGRVPPGTCGIRWRNPKAWTWAPDPTDLLPSSGTYPMFLELEFSGPYPGCGNDPYRFPYPLTVEGGKAPFGLATHLIVQVPSLDDIEFLDKHHNAILPADPEPDPDPGPGSICDVPEFCEGEELTTAPKETHADPVAPAGRDIGIADRDDDPIQRRPPRR